MPNFFSKCNILLLTSWLLPASSVPLEMFMTLFTIRPFAHDLLCEVPPLVFVIAKVQLRELGKTTDCKADYLEN